MTVTSLSGVVFSQPVFDDDDIPQQEVLAEENGLI